MINQCQNVDFFSQDPLSGRVAIWLASGTALASDTGMRLLMVAHELQGDKYDTNLINAFVERAPIYLSNIDQSPARLEEGRAFANFFSSLTDVVAQSGNKDVLRKLIAQMNPLSQATRNSCPSKTSCPGSG